MGAMTYTARRRPSPKAIILSLLALAGAVLAAGSAAAAYSTGANPRTLTHDSELRSYDVYAPASYTGSTPVPLVVDLHGATSTGAQQRAISGWLAKSDATGFLLVHPDGIDNTWNAGVCCDPSAANNVDDVGFIRAMVIAIQAEGNVDASRIYVTGLSNGGAMTHRLACEAPDVFAAAAPLAFPTPYVDFATECTPSQAIPLLLTMGLTDSIVPYGGGVFESAVNSYDNWKTKNACGPEPEEKGLTFPNAFCDIDTSCTNDTQVGLCSVTGRDFDPPADIFNGHILYSNEDDIVLPDLIWAFWNQNVGEPLPSAGRPALLALTAIVAGAGAIALGRRRR